LSIRERRFAKAVNKILREELQKGNLPSSKEFIWKVNQYLEKTNLSGPSLEFKNVRAKSTARSGDYNNVLDRAYEDLETLYENAVDQQNKSLKHFNKFDVEKDKLDYQLLSLENQLKELILLYGNSGYLNSVYDIFADMSSIDLTKTTANVDISNHEVRLNDVKKTSKKIVPAAYTAFEISPLISPTPEVKTISGTTQDALSDKSNTTWQTTILTTESIAVPSYFHVVFEKKQQINRITLSLQSIKPTFIRVEGTSDGLNWFPLPYYEEAIEVYSEYTFDFPMLEVSRIRFLMAKNEPDNETITEVNGVSQTKYSYLMGIKNISFYTFIYSTSSDFYSKVLDAEPDSTKNFTIDKVSLLVDEELPNGTDIKYYIALPVETGEPEWKDLSPVNRELPKYDQIIDFKNISTSIPNTFSIDTSISIGEYEMESLYAHGIRFYKIGEVANRKIIDGTEQLFAGKNTWGMKHYEYQHSGHASHLPSMSDWVAPQNQVNIDYVQIADGKPGVVLNKERTTTAMNYMFTLGVFSTKTSELVTAVPASTDPIAIYMNGKLLFQGIPNSTNRLNYLFQNGWNEIVVLVYTRESVNTVNGSTVDISFDPKSYGSNVYSQAKALMKVSLFDLRYNTINTDYTKYSLLESNTSTYVILNHATPGLEYEFYYNYIDGTVKDEILFKAVLTRDDDITVASPKLKSYRLRFS
jgi:hypothetical protein